MGGHCAPRHQPASSPIRGCRLGGPQPARADMAVLDDFPERVAERLRAVASAALGGALDADGCAPSRATGRSPSSRSCPASARSAPSWSWSAARGRPRRLPDTRAASPPGDGRALRPRTRSRRDDARRGGGAAAALPLLVLGPAAARPGGLSGADGGTRRSVEADGLQCNRPGFGRGRPGQRPDGTPPVTPLARPNASAAPPASHHHPDQHLPEGLTTSVRCESLVQVDLN